MEYRRNEFLLFNHFDKPSKLLWIDHLKISNNHHFLNLFFLACSAQWGMWRLPAVSLNDLPHVGHLMYPDAYFIALCICWYFSYYSAFLGLFEPPFIIYLNARLWAFHFAIFSFAFGFCSYNFLAATAPFFINFFWSASTILWSWALNYFLLLWNTFLQTF